MTSPLLPLGPAALFADATAIPLIRLDRQSRSLLPLRRVDDEPSPRSRRWKLWELADTLHCSIIGTCLSNADLRRVLVKLDIPNAESADEHDLHVHGVSLASRPDAGAKLLHKALDGRHATAIRHYATAVDEATLKQLWEESLHQGDVPGGYWAVLTHPITSEAVAQQAFQDVHMLSHLVGAANRADIRRLRALERENESLQDKLRQQERHLRDGFRFRDLTIRELRDMLANRNADEAGAAPADGGEVDALRATVAELSTRLNRETSRQESLDLRLKGVCSALQTTQAALDEAARERDALAKEVAALEDEVAALLVSPDGAAGFDLAHQTILYVGGRPRQIPQIRSWVERGGGQFLHHDGGVEHSLTLLPGLASRADLLCFPIDCVSHQAVATIKRLCRQSQKSYRPLRTSGIAALMSALASPAGEVPADAPTHTGSTGV